MDRAPIMPYKPNWTTQTRPVAAVLPHFGDHETPMTQSFVATVLLSMTIGAAMVCIGLVVRGCITSAKWPLHAIALVYFFGVMTAEAAELLHQQLPDPRRLTWLQGTTIFLIPSLGACIWFYVRGLTSQAAHFRTRDLWHLVPIAVCIFGALPYMALPAPRRAALLAPGSNLLDPENIAIVGFVFLAWVAWIAILLLYGGAAMSRLIKHRRTVRDLYSQVDGVSLAWLHMLIVIFFTFMAVVIAAALLPAMSSADLLSHDMVALFYFCVVLVLGIFGVLQRNTIPAWNELGTAAHAGRRYARSALQNTDLTRIARKLDAAMQGAQLWQNPNLALIDLAEHTGVSQNNISQTLNEHLGKNFYDYVNGWRIRAACAALRDTNDPVLTIAENVGFNAKSTFNAAFKKTTGKTPRAYRTEAASK